jgi:hypothetical protein
LLLLLLITGCGGGMVLSSNPSNADFTITSISGLVNTNGQVQFRAMSNAGGPAAVNWKVTGGENNSSFGQGSIDAKGLYTPPAAVSHDAVKVQVQAQLESDIASTATAVLTVTPGYLTPLSPENVALTAGTSVQVTGQLAEVGNGTVHWELSTSPTGGGLATGLGSLGQPTCRTGLTRYTTCSVTYTAPGPLPAATPVYVVGRINDTSTALSLHVLLNDGGIVSNPIANQATQSGMLELGSSGGNDNDYDTYLDSAGTPYISDCCGGTLGALVEDSSHKQYILSNNHVLAESDQGSIGDAIDQPGLIDDNCTPLGQAGSTVRSVGTLKYFVPVGTTQSNVDAALAQVTPGAVDATGGILGLGAPGAGANGNLGTAPPTAGTGEALNATNLSGLQVAKSGRTTGLTCSTVDVVNLSVQVDYFKDCAETQPYYAKLYTNQIAIPGTGFSDSGDSGSLIVDASNAQPVGLFFAGGTDGDGSGLSVANPIGDVLMELGSQAGTQLSVVGSSTPHAVSCLNYDVNTMPSEEPMVAPSLMAKAQRVALTSGAALVNADLGVLGVAAGKSADNPGQPALLVYVDKARQAVVIPQTVNGLRTVVIATDAASLAGGTAPTKSGATAGIRLTASALAAAATVQQQQAKRLMADPAIFGVGVSESHDNPAEAALLVLVDAKRTPEAMPATLGGLRLRYMRLQRFHVTRSKYDAGGQHHSACALKSMERVSPDIGWQPAEKPELDLR